MPTANPLRNALETRETNIPMLELRNIESEMRGVRRFYFGGTLSNLGLGVESTVNSILVGLTLFYTGECV